MGKDPFDDLSPIPNNVTKFGAVRKTIGRKSEKLRRLIRFAGDVQPPTDLPYLIKGWLAP